jgi:hypothetical protein
MNIMKLAVLLLVVMSVGARAQDFVVTNKGDTIRGEVRLLSYDLLDRVRIIHDKKKTQLTAKQVRMVYTREGRATYHPRPYENAIRFMKLLKPGYLSLYAFRADNQNTLEGRYLVKMDGTYTDIPNLNFKKIMITFLGDCEVVKSGLEAGQYGRGDIDRIIDDYNACIDSNTEEQKRSEAIFLIKSQKIAHINNFKKEVQSLPDFPAKKDALDLLTDMSNKVNDGQVIPNYQVETLRGFLIGHETAKEDLEKLISVIQNH